MDRAGAQGIDQVGYGNQTAAVAHQHKGVGPQVTGQFEQAQKICPYVRSVDQGRADNGVFQIRCGANFLQGVFGFGLAATVGIDRLGWRVVAKRGGIGGLAQHLDSADKDDAPYLLARGAFGQAYQGVAVDAPVFGHGIGGRVVHYVRPARQMDDRVHARERFVPACKTADVADDHLGRTLHGLGRPHGRTYLEAALV